LAEIRNLEEAERWYQRSLELYLEGDSLGRGDCMAQLGSVAYERFRDAREAGKPAAELAGHLSRALDLYTQALKLFPNNAINDLAVAHHQLGVIYMNAGKLDSALAHCRESLGYDESAGNLYGAAQTRRNVARLLASRGRFADAREYTVAALRNFQTFGEGAKDMVLKALELIAWIDELVKAESEK
jgi:tetratricopeptide (TPR) repeat protein